MPGELVNNACKNRLAVPMSQRPDVSIFHALAFCCTTDFDLQRHLQQFYPPFTGLVACMQNESPVSYIPESQPLASTLSYVQCQGKPSERIIVIYYGIYHRG